MKCVLCLKKDPDIKDTPELDVAAEHLLMTMSIQGSVHVHGPFANEYVMRKMADAFMAEMEKAGIRYTPPTQHIPGN
jgi:hypothetical protein